jgi:hypothetical protein
MGLAFLQPLLLLGTLATAIPVLIHLIYRRRALVHVFPAVRFLLLADKRTARKFRLHQWLLLALRILVLLLLALALARPYLTGDNAQAAAALPPQSTVILLDNSLSMQYRDAAGPRFQRAKAMASQLLQELRTQDSAAVLPLLTTVEADQPPAVLSQDAAVWEANLAAISPRHDPMHLQPAFQRALTLLRQSTASRRRLVVISDLTTNGWEDFHLSQFEILPDQVELYLVRVGPPQRDDNVLVESIRITEQPFIEQVPVEITAWVRNRSATKRRNLRVDLLMGQRRVGQQLVDLHPDEQVAVPFRITAPAAGVHWGEIRLEEDTLVEDDRFYFALRTVAPSRILIVDGDPGPSLFDSEIFYLSQALQPHTALRHAMFYPTPVTWEGLTEERLSDYQVIILCNVEAVAPQVRQRLHQFVTSGGGLLFFAGNRVDPERYNEMWYRSDTLLLPTPLGQPVQPPAEQPQTIAAADPDHEALRLFTMEPELLQYGRFYRYIALEEANTVPDVHTLLSLANGQPLLVEKQIGTGNVLFFASSADRDWTDLPMRTAYVPLLHGLVSHLAELSSAAQRPTAMMPEPVTITGKPEDAGGTISIRTPDGHKRLVRYAAEASDVVVPFAEYTIPGIYHLTGPQGNDMLTVNATRAESNFTKLQSDDLQTRLQPLRIVVEEEETFGQATAKHALPSKELAGMLLLAVVGLLMTENVCANRL